MLTKKFKKLNKELIENNVISKGETAKGIITFFGVGDLFLMGKKVDENSLKELIGIDVSTEFKNLKKSGYFNFKDKKLVLEEDFDKDFGIVLALIECVANGMLKRVGGKFTEGVKKKRK